MSEHPHPRYYFILGVLTVLTALEIGVAIEAVSGKLGFLVTALVLIALAAWKAVLVARHYMHLKFDAKLLSLIAITPLVLFAFLVIAAIQDTHVWPS